MAVIATAGHVDHGKSTLVRALTGIDPDRLAEEKRRGMTIDLGFAHVIAPDGTELSFVDVPGHSDFVRTMIAGTSGVDVALLVIDAHEGWKPQTTEHLAVCELLGVCTGVVALTKADLVDEARLDEIAALTRDELSSSPIIWMDTIPVSAVSGTGLADLTVILERAVRATPPRHHQIDRPRLFIDRVFSIVGTGTVVTGTLESGTLHVGDELISVPGGHRSVVRSIQMHGRQVKAGLPGTRCAVNLGRTSTDDVGRGEVLVIESQWALTTAIDVAHRPARGTQLSPSNGRGWTMHVGTARRQVSVRILPTAESSIRVRFEQPLPLSPGDRIVLRHTGTDTTVAGGTVLDIDPRRRTSHARPDGSTDSILADHGWVTIGEARLLTGRDVTPVVDGWAAAAATVSATTERLSAMLDLGEVDVVSLSVPERALIATLTGVVVEHGTARRGGRNSLLDHSCIDAIKKAGVTPPPSNEFDRDVIRRLVGVGVLFEHDGVAFHRDVLDGLAPVLDALWHEHPTGFTVSQLRETLGITRKHAVPLAECLDKARITKRSGDLRLRAN